MASQDKNQPSSALLWLIIPAAVFVTLLFVNANHKAAPNKPHLDGAMPIKEKKEMKMEEAIDTKVDSTAHADTTHSEGH